MDTSTTPPGTPATTPPGTPAGAYLDALRAELADAPPHLREEVLADVRAHLDDAAAEGRPLDRVLADLGPVSRYREELGLPAGLPTTGDGAVDDGARRASTALQVAALVSALLGAVVALKLQVLTSVPWQAGTGQPQTADVPSDLDATLALAVLPAALALLVPVASLALSRLAPRWRAGAGDAVDLTALVGGVAVGLAAVVDLGGTGWLYVPTAGLLLVAAAVPCRLRRTGGRRPGPWRRWGSAALVALPAGLYAGVLVSQGFRDQSAAQIAVEAALPVAGLVAGVLVGLGSRLAHLAVVAAGAVVMVTGLVELGMLVLAVWWLGALWVGAGLVGLVDGTVTVVRPPRRRTPRTR